MMEWNIQSRAEACRMCGRPFVDHQAYHTMLLDEGTGYVRHDSCEGCWRELSDEGKSDRRGFVSHWRGEFEVPPPRPEPIRRETAETLLRKLLEFNDPRHGPACFILAVMLERKRILKVREELHQHGRRVFIYEQPGTGDVFTITDPALQLGQLDEVQRDVARLLESGPPASSPQAGQAAPPTHPNPEAGPAGEGGTVPAGHSTDVP